MTTKEKAEVMLASEAPGAVVQRQHYTWDKSLWQDALNPEWNWAVYDFRIKPAPKLVPLSREDFEGVVTWMRSTADGPSRLVLAVDVESVIVFAWGSVERKRLHSDGWQYSQPSRFEGWRPCSKEAK